MDSLWTDRYRPLKDKGYGQVSSRYCLLVRKTMEDEFFLATLDRSIFRKK